MAEKLSRRLVEIINELRAAAKGQEWFGVGVAAGNLKRIVDEVKELEASQEPRVLSQAPPGIDEATDLPGSSPYSWDQREGVPIQQLTLDGELLGQVYLDHRTIHLPAEHHRYCVDVVAATPGGGQLVAAASNLLTIAAGRRFLEVRMGLCSTNYKRTD